MTFRSHTETFVNFRNSAVKQRSFTRYEDTGEDEERVKLVIAGEDPDSTVVTFEDSPNGHAGGGQNGEPVWMGPVDEFRYEASKLSDRIERLKQDQETLLRLKSSALFDEGERSVQSLEEEIEVKSAEISKSFNRLHGLVLEMKNLSTVRSVTSSSPTTSKILRNILQYECREVASLSERLKNYHRDHIHRLSEKEKYMEQFVINFDDIDLDDHPPVTYCPPSSFPVKSSNEFSTHHQQPEHQIGFDNQNYQPSHPDVHLQDQLQLDLEDDTDLLREREVEMTSILKSMTELNQIFHEMNSLVVNQGSLLDRIDYNMELVQMKVDQGAVQLSRAEKSARAARKLKCMFILGGSLLLALFILILQS